MISLFLVTTSCPSNKNNSIQNLQSPVSEHSLNFSDRINPCTFVHLSILPFNLDAASWQQLSVSSHPRWSHKPDMSLELLATYVLVGSRQQRFFYYPSDRIFDHHQIRLLHHPTLLTVTLYWPSTCGSTHTLASIP